jgi:IS1 family transposase
MSEINYREDKIDQIKSVANPNELAKSTTIKRFRRRNCKCRSVCKKIKRKSKHTFSI